MGQYIQISNDLTEAELLKVADLLGLQLFMHRSGLTPATYAILAAEEYRPDIHIPVTGG